MIKVLLADDQAMIREAFAALLRLEADLEVVGQAATCAAAVDVARDTDPDVVLMDVQMPSGPGPLSDGIAATAQIVAERPRARVIILTTFGRPGYLRRAMEAGAVGFMVKDAPADQLIEGIRRVHRGLRVVDPALAADSLSLGASPLTERETEVLAAAAGGGSTGAHCREGLSVGGHGAQPPVGRDGQTRRGHPGRGGSDGHRERLAQLSDPASRISPPGAIAAGPVRRSTR